MAKIFTRLNFQTSLFSFAKTQNYTIITFKMLKMEFKFKYTWSTKESATHCSQFISAKVKKLLRKSQVEILEKLRKLRLRQNESFLFKKKCMSLCFCLQIVFLSTLNVRTWKGSITMVCPGPRIACAALHDNKSFHWQDSKPGGAGQTLLHREIGMTS